jgi:hypothetical protein
MNLGQQQSLTLRIGVFLFSLLILGCGGTGGVEQRAAPATPGEGAPGSARIEGNPSGTVAPGSTYSFQPIVSGINTGAARFSAANLPAWLSIDSRTGRLTGTPSQSDVGVYSNMSITVSDGASSATLGPFSITVAEGNGTAVISWLAPTTNTDGSPLTDLAGFVVVYGKSPSELVATLTISNPSVSTCVVEGLGPGLWYFGVQAVNSAGVRSAISTLTTKSIS